MNVMLGQVDEYYCDVCEEPLGIEEEHMEFTKKISSLWCKICGRMYELEFPVTGTDHPQLRMIGYGGEWE